jgi:hypothetical protein
LLRESHRALSSDRTVILSYPRSQCQRRRVSEICGPGKRVNPAIRTGGRGLHDSRSATSTRSSRQSPGLLAKVPSGPRSTQCGRGDQPPNGPQGPGALREVERGTRLGAPDVACQRARSPEGRHVWSHLDPEPLGWAVTRDPFRLSQCRSSQRTPAWGDPAPTWCSCSSSWPLSAEVVSPISHPLLRPASHVP